MSNPDFVTLAKAMGVYAIRCDNAADLPAKMKEFMEYDNSRPVLLDACVIEVCRTQVDDPLFKTAYLLFVSCRRRPSVRRFFPEKRSMTWLCTRVW